VLARNEARNLPHLFDALPPGIETFVLDHESVDETAAIAQARGARVVVRPFSNFVDARRFALSQVRTPWTLMIDADEIPDARLREAMLAAPGDADGYEMLRTTYYCGKALRMWSGERVLRLFRADRVRLEAAPVGGGNAQLHERWICEGTVRTLQGTLEHYSYPNRQSYRVKFESYTSTEARGLRPSAGAALAQTLLVPLRFVNLLLRRGALLDGPRGWTVAWYSALYPAIVRWKSLRKNAA
jgi:glycosyltransferase involved in cell wall biosynthesis